MILAAELAEALRIAALAYRLSATYGPAIALGLLQGRVSAAVMALRPDFKPPQGEPQC